MKVSPSVRVLVVTLFEDDDSVFMALRAGARGYVLKDADEEEMVHAIRAVGRGEEHYDFMILSQWSDPVDSERNIQWTREFFETMQPFLERGAYVNLMGEEGEDAVKEAYGSNYGRLAALKSKYDPTNFFSLNHNIKPMARSSATF